MFPGLGVGVVAAIEDIPVGASSVEAYRIEFDDDRGRLWVPLDSAGSTGLRPIMSEDVAEEAFEVVTTQKPPKHRANWNRRRKRYTEWLTSHDARDVARLVGELTLVRRAKQSPLSFGERRLLEKGRELLVSELAAALGIAKVTVEKRLDSELAAA